MSETYVEFKRDMRGLTAMGAISLGAGVIFAVLWLSGFDPANPGGVTRIFLPLAPLLAIIGLVVGIAMLYTSSGGPVRVDSESLYWPSAWPRSRRNLRWGDYRTWSRPTDNALVLVSDSGRNRRLILGGIVDQEGLVAAIADRFPQ